MAFLTPTEIRDLARRHGIRPRQELGQNFLIDPNTTRRILRLSGVGENDSVIEVGAGLGTLTSALGACCARVVAVEADPWLLAPLSEVAGGFPNVEIVQADAMKLEYSALLDGGPWRMVSNLPYSIATPLLAKLASEAPAIADFFVMVQREVGERLTARPGSRAYGSVSVLIEYYCEARLAGRVSPAVFWPVPKVESALVSLARRPPPVEVGADTLMPVVRAAFSQRRKMLRNAVSAGLKRPLAEVEMALSLAGIDPSARAEMLSLAEFAGLTEVLGVLEARG